MSTYVLECVNSFHRKIDWEDRFRVWVLVVVPLRLPFFDLIWGWRSWSCRQYQCLYKRLRLELNLCSLNTLCLLIPGFDDFWRCKISSSNDTRSDQKSEKGRVDKGRLIREEGTSSVRMMRTMLMSTCRGKMVKGSKNDGLGVHKESVWEKHEKCNMFRDWPVVVFYLVWIYPVWSRGAYIIRTERLIDRCVYWHSNI